MLDIYATSIDYEPKADVSREFFKVVQNKMHWASHGHTAAEIIAARTDANQPNMGMTNWPGNSIRKADATVAKNYLQPDEVEILNRMVTAYLELAELQDICLPAFLSPLRGSGVLEYVFRALPDPAKILTGLRP